MKRLIMYNLCVLLVLKSVIHSCVDMQINRVIDFGCLHEYNASIRNNTSEDGRSSLPIPLSVEVFLTGPNGLRNISDGIIFTSWIKTKHAENDEIHDSYHPFQGYRTKAIFSASNCADGELAVHDVTVHVASIRDAFEKRYLVCVFTYLATSTEYPDSANFYLVSSPSYFDCRKTWN